jgi:hypothetical protein
VEKDTHDWGDAAAVGLPGTGQSLLDATRVRAPTLDPVYTARVVSKVLPAREMLTPPLAVVGENLPPRPAHMDTQYRLEVGVQLT